MHIVVREFAKLTTDRIGLPGPDLAQVSSTAFDWLCRESARIGGSATLVQMESRRCLRLDNYVGVIQTPCGTTLEILPKTFDESSDARASRALLRRMLARCLDLPMRESGLASIDTFDAPVTEWVMRQFLESLDVLVKRGVRFDYHRISARERFLRGRLDLSRQLRQRPGCDDQFCIQHDVFDGDRPENRLLRAALDRVLTQTSDASNWRLARELAQILAEISPSVDHVGDFRRWGRDRLMAHYRDARPWCSLILNEVTPLATAGDWEGKSLLFPMEKLFERYVESCLRRSLPKLVTLRRTVSNEFLCEHRGAAWFNLQPDLMLQMGACRVTLDTKWKLLDSARRDAGSKYGLSQADFYQLFAYGHKYQAGQGDLVLIYPSTDRFNTPLPEFRMMEDMRLWVVPFSLREERLLDFDVYRLLESSAA